MNAEEKVPPRVWMLTTMAGEPHDGGLVSQWPTPMRVFSVLWPLPGHNEAAGVEYVPASALEACQREREELRAAINAAVEHIEGTSSSMLPGNVTRQIRDNLLRAPSAAAQEPGKEKP